jgi:hypothetical protein
VTHCPIQVKFLFFFLPLILLSTFPADAVGGEAYTPTTSAGKAMLQPQKGGLALRSLAVLVLVYIMSRPEIRIKSDR